MQTHGTQRAVRFVEQHRRVVRRAPLVVDEAALGCLDALVVRDTRLAVRDGARREVEQDGRFTDTREGDAERVRAETGVAAAERRDHEAAADVDEVDADEPRRRALLGPVTDAADVVGVAQAHERETVLAGPFDADRHRVERHRLTEAVHAVDDEDGARVRHRLQFGVDDEPTRGGRADVRRDHADTVRVVPREVGGDEVVGDEARLAFVAAERVTDGADEVVRHGGRDDACGHGGRIGRHVSSVGVRESGPGGARADPVPTNDARLRPRSTTTARV